MLHMPAGCTHAGRSVIRQIRLFYALTHAGISVIIMPLIRKYEPTVHLYLPVVKQNLDCINKDKRLCLSGFAFCRVFF